MNLKNKKSWHWYATHVQCDYCLRWFNPENSNEKNWISPVNDRFPELSKLKIKVWKKLNREDPNVYLCSKCYYLPDGKIIEKLSKRWKKVIRDEPQ